MTTHISYTTAKKLKEFLGRKAPRPITDGYWQPRYSIGNLRMKDRVQEQWECEQNKKRYPAYQLHDLLSRQFCEAFAKNLSNKQYPLTKEAPGMLADKLCCIYYNEGMPAVEKTLNKMMGAKP